MKRWIVVLVTILAGCSLLPAPEVETRYVLGPVEPRAAAPSQPVADEPVVVLVARPYLPLELRGNRLVLVKDGTLSHYAGKGWSAPLPDLLQAALVRDLAAAWPARVVTADTSVKADYEVRLDVFQFATVQEENTVAVVVRADLRLVDSRTRAVTARVPFAFRQPLEALTSEATLQAYQEAWRLLMNQAAVLVVEKTVLPVPVTPAGL